eukprot:scaffold1526_cov88-Isochrysis_galbana.AAC.3
MEASTTPKVGLARPTHSRPLPPHLDGGAHRVAHDEHGRVVVEEDQGAQGHARCQRRGGRGHEAAQERRQR